MRGVTIRQLQIFSTAAAHLSFARTSEQLHLTQAAVSLQVKHLEDLVGLALFERRGRKVHLTEAGEHLARYARVVLEALRDADAAISALKGLRGGRIAVGAVSTAKYFAPALIARFRQRHPDVRFTEPATWRDERFNGLAKPVVGVCWYEARAYCRWLAGQSGLPFRLPTEVEWEAMARGPSGGAISGERPRGNVLAVHVRATTPVGVFPDSDTPLGATDPSGNVTEWTSSAWGRDPDRADFRYPYDPADGRERPDLPSDVRRVLRSGAWLGDPAIDHPSFRGNFLPSHRTNYYGFRVALDRQG